MRRANGVSQKAWCVEWESTAGRVKESEAWTDLIRASPYVRTRGDAMHLSRYACKRRKICHARRRERAQTVPASGRAFEGAAETGRRGAHQQRTLEPTPLSSRQEAQIEGSATAAANALAYRKARCDSRGTRPSRSQGWRATPAAVAWAVWVSCRSSPAAVVYTSWAWRPCSSSDGWAFSPIGNQTSAFKHAAPSSHFRGAESLESRLSG